MAQQDIKPSPHDEAFHAEVENAKDGGDELVGKHYTPESEVEKALDKRINWKLDLTVLLVLSISFIVSHQQPPLSLLREARSLLTAGDPSSAASTRPTSASSRPAAS